MMEQSKDKAAVPSYKGTGSGHRPPPVHTQRQQNSHSGREKENHPKAQVAHREEIGKNQEVKPSSIPVTAPRISSQRVSPLNGIRTGTVGAGAAVYNTVKQEVNKDGSMGAAIVSGGLTAVEGGYTALKLGQTVTDVAIKTPGIVHTTVQSAVKVGKGAIDVAVTTGRLTITITQTVGWHCVVMKNGYFPFHPLLTKQVFQQYAKRTSLIHTATYKNITTGVKTTIQRIRGLNLKRIASAAGHGAMKVAKNAVVKSVPKTAKITGDLTLGAASAMMASDDMTVQGVGTAMTAITYGAKTTVVATKMAGRTVHTAAKAGKATVKGIRFVAKNGWKAAWHKIKRGAASSVAGAIKGIGNAMIRGVKALGMKLLVPIGVVVIIVVMVMSLFGAVGGGAATGGTVLFGGVFSLKQEDGTVVQTQVRDYIANSTYGIPVMRAEYVNKLFEELSSQYRINGGSYDYVRWKTDSSKAIRQATMTEIDRKFYDETRLANIIQPLFNAIILTNNDLQITEEEGRMLLTELFDSLFRTDYTEIIEYCGESAEDGSGNPRPAHRCGYIHALSSCPNKCIGVHETAYTCSSCCSMTCPGHVADDTPNPEMVNYCEGCMHRCTGYSYCGGHKVYLMTLTMDGVYELMYRHFIQPINDLADLPVLTEDQEARLASLKTGYGVCQAMITIVNHEYAGGLSRNDLEDVEWYESTRQSCPEVVNLALSQLGQGGGEPYWSYAGFTYRVEWCGCFVHWVMNNAGVGHLYAQSYNNYSVSTLAQWFKDHGQFVLGEYLDQTAGDVILFDWEPDGSPDHVGIVLGRDDTYIYTIEGNSGDSVRIQRYPIGSSVIYGFVPMDYSSLTQ